MTTANLALGPTGHVTIPVNGLGASTSVMITGGGGGGGSGAYIMNNSGWNTASTNIQSTLKVSGDAVFDGDITVKGRSVFETLEKIEERLAILVPNVRLEQDWKELQDLRMQYLELEKKLTEQQRVFDILKKNSI